MKLIDKSAEIIYTADKKKTPCLVKLAKTYRCEGKTKSQEQTLKKCMLINMDGKTVLTYDESISKKSALIAKSTSSIFCYKNFFVREQNHIVRNVDTNFSYAYQVYNYEGKAIFCDSDIWTGDEGLIEEIEERIKSAAAAGEKE